MVSRILESARVEVEGEDVLAKWDWKTRG
jgi:hypothetical protein